MGQVAWRIAMASRLLALQEQVTFKISPPGGSYKLLHHWMKLVLCRAELPSQGGEPGPSRFLILVRRLRTRAIRSSYYEKGRYEEPETADCCSIRRLPEPSSKDDKGGRRSDQAEGFTDHSVTLSQATYPSPRKDAHLAEGATG